MKKLFSLIMVLILSGVLTACNNQFGGTETGNPTITTVPSDAATSGDDGMDAQAGPGSEVVTPTPVIVLAHGTNGSLEFPAQNVVIKTEADFTAFWAALFSGQVAEPSVDFNSRMVIATVMGQKNSGGYSITMTTLSELADELTVNLTEMSPGTTCVVTQSFTNPYHIISVVKSDDVVGFSATEVTEDCP